MVSHAVRRRLAALFPALLCCCLLALTVPAGAQTGSNRIDGFVFNDASGDDLFGTGDVTLSGVTVTLQDANGAKLASTVTDTSGEFQFRNLPTATYLVTETDPPGVGSVDAQPGTRGVNVDLNTVRIEMVAGLDNYSGTLFLDRQMATPPAGPNIILGTVLNDANGNGSIDVGEAPVPDVQVTLQKEDGSPIASRRSSRFGEFAFSGLAAGTYLLVETDPTGAAGGAALPGPGAQVVNANTLRVTTAPDAVRYAGNVFLDRLSTTPEPPIPTPPPPTPPPAPTPTPGLVLLLWADRTVAAPGDLLTYTFSVADIATAAADRAAVFCVIPSGAQFVDASNGGFLAGDTVVWSFAALATNTGGIGSFRVRVLPNTPSGTLVRNQAQLDVPGRKAIVDSNLVSTIVAPAGAAMTVAKSVDHVTAQPGDVVTYTLTYTNVRAAPLADVTLLDPLPAGLSFMDTDVSALFDLNARSLHFDRGTLGPGAVGTVSFRARVDAGVADGAVMTNQAQVLAVGQPPVRSNTVDVTVATGSFAGTYSAPTNAPQPTAMTVDPQSRFTLLTFPGSGQPPVLAAQGALKGDGSFDVSTSDGARLTGRIDAGSRTAVVTVQRANLPDYTAALTRANDFAPLFPVMIGTFQGSAIDPSGDRLRVRLSTDPGGNATFHADLVRFASAQSNSRSGSYQVTSDGRLNLGSRVDGQFLILFGSPWLIYTFAGEDGYRVTFQMPLVRV